MRQVWLIAGLVVVVLSACGSSSSTRTTASVSLAEAVKKTEQIPTGQLNVVVSASQGGQSAVLLGYQYVFDQTRQLRSVTADYRKLVSLQPASLGGLNPADFVIHVIVERRRALTLYMSFPAFLRPTFQSKLPVTARHRAWMRFHAAELQKAAGTSLGPAQGLVTALAHGPTSPLFILDALSTSTATMKGSAHVAGVSTTRLSTTANMVRAGTFGQLATQLGQGATPRWAAEVWVDGNSLIRRVRFSSPPIASQGNATITVTCETQGLGGSVAINPPSATDTFDASALPH